MHHLAHVQVVVGIQARPHYRRRSQPAAGSQAHVYQHAHTIRGIRRRNVPAEKQGGRRIQTVQRNLVVREWVAQNLRIGGAHRFGWIKRRVGMRQGGIVNCASALAEIASGFERAGHREGLRHRFAGPQSLVVGEEKSLLAPYRPPGRRAEIVSHQVRGTSHLGECARVQRIVADKLVHSSMKLVAARAGGDVDLAAARAAHVGRIAAGLHFES